MPTGLLFISVLIGLTTAFFLENHRSMTEGASFIFELFGQS